MRESALRRKTGLWSLALDGYPIQCEYIPRALGYFRKNPSQTSHRAGGDMEFPRVLKNTEIPGVN